MDIKSNCQVEKQIAQGEILCSVRVMKSVLIAIAFMVAASPVSAHCYSVWRYPTPQRCHLATTGKVGKSGPKRIETAPNQEPLDIPIPSLLSIDWGAAPANRDEAIRLRLLGEFR